MTSNTTIEAHCGTDKRVVVHITDRDTNEKIDTLYLEDGEKLERSFWGDRVITTYEEDKP